MLLFEFVAELFQFEHREPELAPSFQLPPNMTAFYPCCPLRRSLFIQDPSNAPTSASNACAANI